jgi:hypothetical protein
MASRTIVHDEAFRQSRTARFWKDVDTSAGYDGCWPWRGSCTQGGYGVVSFLGRYTTAHRIAYELDKGEQIPDGIEALHECDNPPCCNPRHVFLGTQKDNIADMHAKGRAGDCRLFGENHGRAKLKDHQVEEIRDRYRKEGLTQAQLAGIYGIGPSQISRIILGQSRSGIVPVISGENAPNAKLTDDDEGYWSERRLADWFEVGRSQVHRILRGESRA